MGEKHAGWRWDPSGDRPVADGGHPAGFSVQQKRPRLPSLSKDRSGHLCILMEYCEHGDIFTHLQDLRRTQIPHESQLLEWFTEIVWALQSLHQQKILHRDLKTQNIFLAGSRPPLAAKLGDFGVAKVLSSTADLAKTQIGTPFYMSPELINSHPYSYKSDVWGLGCVLYEIVNGHRAFDAQSLNGLALKIIKGSYTPISASCSQSTKQLIQAMLTKNPSHRPSLKEILHMPLIRSKILPAYRSSIAAGAADARLECETPFRSIQLRIAVTATAPMAATAWGALRRHLRLALGLFPVWTLNQERRTTRCDTGAAGCPFGGTPGASRGSFTPEAALPVRTLVEGQDFAVFQRHGATAREASLKEMLETLASSAGMRAILMGEVHDDAVTHLLQLAVLKHLRRHGQRRLILSMEMFEMDVQEVLDEYVLHKAIRIRVIAANAPRRYVSMVSRKGEQFLRGLEANGCRSLLPPFPLPLPSPAYRRKFEETMSMPTLQSDTGGSCPFIGFSSEDLRSVRPETMQAQLLWDHAMAKSVAEALRADPEAPECVVLHLCGAFHCAHGLGIPEALPRYCPQLHPEAEVLHMGPKRCPEGVTNIICWPGSVGATLKAVRGGSVPKPLETMGDWVIITEETFQETKT
eukprot:g9443.t1